MSSRKKEERNEKIIRGLMKLPPNRRCINCNSLGPQYVCTTFWTFVCVTCSGIHREFTHRVKSVSMAKFTSQEVDALQSGGNQCARDIYLKGWDPQSQRLPNNSNAEKIREFIKNVYVDKKYAGGKSSEKPPRDVQRSRSHEEETRRASSYHSYSQSPPYDFQYEERRYGKHAPALTRKPGSDKGLYEGKFSSFLSSSRLNDHITEDGFVNEGSNPRMSDYSVSSGSDPFRSDSQSPNFQKDIGSTYGETSRDVLGEELRLHIGRDEGKIPCRQRTISSGSFGSFDSNSMSFKSISSAGLVEIASEPEQSVESHHKELFTVSSFPRSSVSGNSDALDFFSSPFAPQNVTSAASISNKSQFPESTSKSSFDLCQSSSSVTAPTFSAHQSGHTLAASSLDFFSEIPPQLSMATVEEKSPEIVIPQNEGWATFDSRNTTPIAVENPSYVTIPSSDGNSEGNFDPLSLVQWASFEDSSAGRPPSSSPAPFQESSQHVEGTLNAVDTQWPSFEDFSAHGPSSLTPTLWNESQQVGETTLDTTGAQSWNAFEDSTGQLPTQNTQTSTDQVETQHPSITDANMDFGVSEDLNRERIPKAAVDIEPPFSGISTHAEVQPFAVDLKSSNPFDLPYDSDMESRNKFWDMGSLQAALPNDEMPPSFAGSVTQPWFTPSPVLPYIPNGPQGALELLAGQAPNTQIPNVLTQGPVASIGGNPFA